MTIKIYEPIKSFMRREKLRVIFALELVLPFIVAGVAYAQSSNLNITQPQDIGTKILCPIATWMFWILISVCTIMILYAAFLYVTARGEAEKVSKAHKTIAYSAVAVVVALIAKAFPSIVASLIGQTVNGC